MNLKKLYNKKLLLRLFPKYVNFFELVNNNVLFHETIAKYGSSSKEILGKNRFDYFNYINEKVICNKPIDFLEFGVYQGESISYWARINSHADSRFFGFDSFEGLPEDFRNNETKGTYSTQGNFPKIDDKRITFVKGLFQKTLPDFLSNFEPREQIVIHMDADLYTSTLYCVTQLNSILKKGSLLLFDEFILQHEFIAFHDYYTSYNRDFSIVCRVGGWAKIACLMN